MFRTFGVLMLACVLPGAGCTLTRLQRESGEMESRIVEKERDLGELERGNAALLAERKNLLAALDDRRTTLADLDAGLEKLRRENAALASGSERQRAEKQRLDAEIRKFQAEIARLGGDRSISDTAKRERIAALKKQIKNYLEIMLTQ